MAQRKSATKTEARERARRAATKSMAREQRLLELGEEFFVAQGETEQILETAEQRIAEIRTKAEQEAARAKEAQSRVVADMKGERVTVPEIAQRLELSAAEVRALLKKTSVGTDAESGAADGAETAAQEPVNV